MCVVENIMILFLVSRIYVWLFLSTSTKTMGITLTSYPTLTLRINLNFSITKVSITSKDNDTDLQKLASIEVYDGNERYGSTNTPKCICPNIYYFYLDTKMACL